MRRVAVLILAFVLPFAFVPAASAAVNPNPQVPYCSNNIMFETGSYCTNQTDVPEECRPYVSAMYEGMFRFAQSLNVTLSSEHGILRGRIVYWANRAYVDERKIDQQKKEIRRLKRQLANRH